MKKFKLKIIIGSTRPGRKGPAIAEWIKSIAEQHTDFEVEMLDLAEINLPFLDEPNHPVLGKYLHQHTKDWSVKIDEADGFIMVTPEYNFGFSAPLKNAIDYLHHEWQYKPVGFVSYGGIAAGTRAVQMLKQILTTLKMVTITESVNIPFFTEYLHEGIFTADERLTNSANAMLREISKWAENLKAMRNIEKVI